MKTESTITPRSNDRQGPPPAPAGKREAKSRLGARTAPHIRIRTILVPIDFSAASMKALKYAAAFAERFGAKLTLLHVIEPIAMPDFAATYPLVMDPNEVAKISKQKLDSLAGQFEINPDLVEKVLVRSGAPFNEISTAARGLKADLIIISTHGRTGLKHLVLGSTTERVVRHADCPVFVVREQEREFI